jgi:transposase
MQNSQHQVLLEKIAELEKTVNKQSERISWLEQDNLSLHKENAELKARLRAYENPHTPSSKKRFKKKPERPSGRLGAPKGHPKWEREQPEPTETVEHSETACPHCKHRLGKPVRTDRRIIEELPEPQPIQVVEHLINHYYCEHCHKEVVARNNMPQGMFGVNAQATTVLLRFEDRLPLRKAVNALQRQGLNMTNVSVQNISQRVAYGLSPEYYKQIQLIRASRVVYADETEMPIDGETWWLWTFTSEQQTIYVIRRRRNSEVPLEILGKQYAGIVTSDGHSVYRKIGSAQQRCWAHIIRESKSLKEEHELYECHHNNLTKIFAKLKRIRAKPPPLKKRLKLKVELEQETTDIVDALDGHSEYRTFAVKLRNAIPSLFTCIIHLFVEPTNNIAERSLRELIVIRKIIGGLRRETGARTMETIVSMLATWKQQEKEPYHTLKQHLLTPL